VVGESVVRVHELARSVYASTGSGVTSKSFMLILVWVGTHRSLGWFQCGSAPITDQSVPPRRRHVEVGQSLTLLAAESGRYRPHWSRAWSVLIRLSTGGDVGSR
jgi:hypothetical protein